MPAFQANLFPPDEPRLPRGFAWAPAALQMDEEAALVAQIEQLPFAAFEFRQYRGLRRIVSFGHSYDYASERLREAQPLPRFLEPLRARASVFAQTPAAELVQTLVTEYAPGAGIGWHRDKAVFDKVVGVSLLSPCTFRFRRARPGERKWDRLSLPLPPRSIYLLDGDARRDWEHSIPAVEALRYSVTFRSFRQG